MADDPASRLPVQATAQDGYATFEAALRSPSVQPLGVQVIPWSS